MQDMVAAKKFYQVDKDMNYVPNDKERSELEQLEIDMDNAKQEMVIALQKFSQEKKVMDIQIFEEKQLPREMFYDLKFRVKDIEHNFIKLAEKV